MAKRKRSKIATVTQPKARMSHGAAATTSSERQPVRVYSFSPGEIKEICAQIRHGWSLLETRHGELC